MGAPLCIYYRLYDLKKSVQLIVAYPKLYIDIALSLELFVNGSLNIFNHQTNVDLDNRFTVYGIRDTAPKVREDKAR